MVLSKTLISLMEFTKHEHSRSSSSNVLTLNVLNVSLSMRLNKEEFAPSVLQATYLKINDVSFLVEMGFSIL